MNIIRVFPRKTSFTPNDDLVFIGDPELFRPKADEIHISVTFSWDIYEGYHLKSAWEQYYPVVKIGGPAFGNVGRSFIPGMYIKNGVTFTTRGCENYCPWCLVPEREGKLIEIHDFSDGYIVQDNNLLQASRQHIERVFAMLRKQRKPITFSGGLQASLIDDWFVDQLKTIRLDALFMRKLRVYCMIGRHETTEQARQRLEAIWELGGLPFAQLYQPPEKFINYSRDWKVLVREWSRPAAMISSHSKGRTLR